MSLFEEKKGNVIQEFFQAGKRKLYLRNKEKLDSIRIDHALDSLDYLKKRSSHYSELENKIVLMLPPKERDQYIFNRIPELIKLTDNYISSLSDPELQKKYEEIFKERKIAEDQTRDRQVQKQAKQIADQMSSKDLKLREAFATKLVDITKKFGSDQQSVMSSLISDKKTSIQIYTFYQKNQISKIHAAIDNLYRDFLTSNNGVQQNHV